MAEGKASNVVKLPADTKAELEKLGPTIDDLEKALETMEKLGMDTTLMREQLEFSKRSRDILLKEFG